MREGHWSLAHAVCPAGPAGQRRPQLSRSCANIWSGTDDGHAASPICFPDTVLLAWIAVASESSNPEDEVSQALWDA